MLREHLPEERRESDRALLAGLGLAELEMAADVLERTTDVDDAAYQVHVPTTKRQELACPQAGIGGGVDERPIERVNRVA